MMELTNEERQLLNSKFHSRREKCNACNFTEKEKTIVNILVAKGLLKKRFKKPSHGCFQPIEQYQLTEEGYSIRWTTKKSVISRTQI